MRAALLAAAMLVVSGAARADDSAVQDLSAASRGRWYGWQLLLVDVATVPTGVALTVPTQSPAPLLLSASGYLLGAPIVHAAHGRVDVIGGSVLLRIGLPFVAGVVGSLAGMAAQSRCEAERTGFGFCFQGLAGTLTGAGVGALTAIILDAALLAYEN